MKRLWLALGLLLAIITLCLTTIAYQQRQIASLLDGLDGVVNAFENNQTDRAYTLAVKLEKDYLRHTQVLLCFMAHGDLIECRESLALLPAILREDNPEEFRMESTRCRAHLEKLSTTELPSLQNIL